MMYNLLTKEGTMPPIHETVCSTIRFAIYDGCMCPSATGSRREAPINSGGKTCRGGWAWDLER
jgi:hypothetical protein